MNRFLLRKWLLILVISPFLTLSAFAQGVITGKVTAAEDHQELPGVSIVVQGTKLGTFSDANGRFTINAPIDSHLIFSFIGYAPQEVIVSSSKVLDIVMVSQNKSLSELVVTALGIKRERKTLSYSVGQVKSEEITNPTNAFSAIEGKVAGLSVNSSGGQPGASANILIRGTSSITGNNQALIVVDGVPIDNSLFATEGNTGGAPSPNRAIDIDPADIENVSVLKGGAAVALYGLQGSNGVVVITTKKGQKGKPKIELSSSVAFDKVNRLPFFQNVYAQGSNGKYLGPEAGAKRSWGPKLSDLRYNGDKTYKYDHNGALVLATDPTATSKLANNYDPVGSFFQTGATYNNNIAVSGGNDNAVYRVSAGVEKQNGIIPLSYFQRINLKTSGEATVFKDMKVSGDISYINSAGNATQQGSNISGAILPLFRTPINFDNKNGASSPRDPSAYMFADGTQRDYTGGLYNNPYFSINQDPFKSEVNRVLGDVNLNYTPLKWLGFNYRLGGDIYTDNRVQNYEVGDVSNGTGKIISDNYINKIINSDIQVVFKHNLTPDLTANLLLGSGIYSNYNNEILETGTNFLEPGFVNLNNSSSISGSTNLTILHRLSYYAILDLAWRDELFLNASYRVDHSTALNPKNNSFQNPSVGLSWVFTELPFLKDNTILSFGKLRASFGTAGNDAPAYSLYNTYNQFGNPALPSLAAFTDGLTNGIVFPFTGKIGGFASNFNLGNPLLKAEKTFTYEFGGELSFFKDRITLDATYYDKEGTNLILGVPLTSSSGFQTQTLNVATMSNKGIELAFNVIPVKVAGFQWSLGANFAKNVNKVKELGVEQVSFGGFTGITVAAIKGYANQSFFGPSFAVDPKSGKQVINDDPTDTHGFGFPIAGQTSQYLGNALPKWLMGITNTFTYKGLRLYGLIDIRHGGSLWNGTEGALASYGRSDITLNRNTQKVFSGVTGHTDVNGNLVVDGAANTNKATLNQYWYQSSNGGAFGSVTSAFVEDGGWVRLREVNLSYSLNKAWFKTGVVKGVDVGLFGRNLWLHTKYHGQDPETSLQGAGNAQGIDYFQVPGTKTYGINLKVVL